jgi:hypothetical protein
MEVTLEQNVNMDPLTDVATVAHVTRHWIESIRWLRHPALNCEPRREVSHVIDAGHCRCDLLFDLVRAEVAVLIEKLREVWSCEIAGSQSAKQRCRCNYNVKSAAAAFAIGSAAYCE